MARSPLNPLTFVETLTPEQGQRLVQYFQQEGFTLTTPSHTVFSAKKKGLVCTLYTSGKLVIQGKEGAAFIAFYLEPEILQDFPHTYPLANADLTSRIGIDESGKGDFFGPLCIAGVFVRSDQFQKLEKFGIKDSKKLTDPIVRKLAKIIQAECLTHIVKINPQKYNEIYPQFNNLNSLLAWGHATTIEQLVKQSGCETVIIDQFANESVVELALKRKKLQIHLTQRHRAEEDLAVAAASILARFAFIEGLDQLSQEIDIPLQNKHTHDH